VHFFKYIADTKKYEYLRSWTCNELRNNKIVGMTTIEVDKNEVSMAVVGRSQHIVHLNVWKHVYLKAAKMQEAMHY
jgi:hypothetical protein